MKKIIILSLSLCIAVFANSQEQDYQLPLNNGQVKYQAQVPVQEQKNIIALRVFNWMQSKKERYHFVQKNKQSAQQLELTGTMRIDPDTGSYRAVDCNFTMKLIPQENGYTYEISNLTFIKEKRAYNVSEVYQGVLNDEPTTRQFIEAKLSAKQRHEFYLRNLSTKMNAFIETLHQEVITSAIDSPDYNPNSVAQKKPSL